MPFLRHPRFWTPVRGTLVFASGFFVIRVVVDYLLHTVAPDRPAEPWWSSVSSVGFGTAIAAWFVYRLLKTLQIQRRLMESLNHEVRNALQVLAYLGSADKPNANLAREAVARIERTVREVSAELGE